MLKKNQIRNAMLDEEDVVNKKKKEAKRAIYKPRAYRAISK